MKICDYCGEMKPCRKQDTLFGIGRPKHHGLDFNWVCDECNKAHGIIRQKQKEEEWEKQKQQQKEWTKERDEILKTIR